jgi:transaldolase / glucose-6-phosphate isomerase
VGPGDYLAIQAFVDPGSPVVGRIEAARAILRDRLRVATTVGLGPRFLHSTGQLHKGGPATGVFVQVVGEPGAGAAGETGEMGGSGPRAGSPPGDAGDVGEGAGPGGGQGGGPVDVPVPGRAYGFATLERAQAAGDLLTLRERGRRAGRVALDELLQVSEEP